MTPDFDLDARVNANGHDAAPHAMTVPFCGTISPLCPPSLPCPVTPLGCGG